MTEEPAHPALGAAGVAAADHYDRLWAEVYGDMQRVGPAHRHLRRILRRLLARLDYRSALDVGCGAGHNVPLLTAGGELERLTGIDVSEAALARASTAHPGAWRRLDVQRERLEGTWDLVLCSLVLEHLPEDAAALRHMRAMAGRHLVVATIGGDFSRHLPYEQLVGHVRNYGPRELQDKLEAAGFSVKRIVRWGFPLYSPVVRRLTRRSVPTRELGPAARAVAHALYGLYFLNSSRRGDLLVVHAVSD
jgi:SAM-dependent methyltransferase